VKIPSGHWILLAASGAACALALAAPRWLPLPPRDDPEFSALLADKAKFASADDATRDGLRRRKSSQEVQGWTPEGFAAFRNNFGSEWRWEAGSASARASTFVLSQDDAPLSSWPALLHSVRILEAQPSLVLRDLEIATTGPRSLRVRITIRIQLGPGDPVRPSVGSRPVSDPLSPAKGAEEVTGRNRPVTSSAPAGGPV
jgi:hypothetical protein